MRSVPMCVANHGNDILAFGTNQCMCVQPYCQIHSSFVPESWIMQCFHKHLHWHFTCSLKMLLDWYIGFMSLSHQRCTDPLLHVEVVVYHANGFVETDFVEHSFINRIKNAKSFTSSYSVILFRQPGMHSLPSSSQVKLRNILNILLLG